jgi:hypothetical protein
VDIGLGSDNNKVRAITSGRRPLEPRHSECRQWGVH